jgi:hypothetical protein
MTITIPYDVIASLKLLYKHEMKGETITQEKAEDHILSVFKDYLNAQGYHPLNILEYGEAAHLPPFDSPLLLTDKVS